MHHLTMTFQATWMETLPFYLSVQTVIVANFHDLVPCHNKRVAHKRSKPAEHQGMTWTPKLLKILHIYIVF